MAESKKVVVLMCDSLERYRFIKKLLSGLTLNGYDFVIATTEPLVYIYSKANGHKVVHITSNSDVAVDDSEIKSLSEKSIEVINGTISVEAAANYIFSGINQLTHYFENMNLACIVIWNGQQVLGRILSKVSDNLNAKRLYLELSNLPDKLFVDPVGVNALSSIANDKDILNSYANISSDRHRLWVESYISAKEAPLPQSITKRSYKFESSINSILKLVFGSIGKRSKIFSSLKHSIRTVSIPTEVTIDDKDVSSLDYIFLPLQVSTDTQIKLHSDVDNEQAIQYGVEKSSTLKKELVIKIHPAENSDVEIEKVISLCRKHGVKISNGNTNFLIDNSSEVITINSTVGLEAMIMDKKVTVLGRALYQGFNPNLLNKYIHGYLVDGVNYFNSDLVSKSKIAEILSYANR